MNGVLLPTICTSLLAWCEYGCYPVFLSGVTTSKLAGLPSVCEVPSSNLSRETNY